MLQIKLLMQEVHNRTLSAKKIPVQTWTGSEVSRSLRLPDFETVGTWRWYGCQLYAPAAFTPQKMLLVLVSVRRLVVPRSIVPPEGLRQWQIPMTSPGIEPATFRSVPGLILFNFMYSGCWHFNIFKLTVMAINRWSGDLWQFVFVDSLNMALWCRNMYGRWRLSRIVLWFVFYCTVVRSICWSIYSI